MPFLNWNINCHTTINPYNTRLVQYSYLDYNETYILPSPKKAPFHFVNTTTQGSA